MIITKRRATVALAFDVKVWNTCTVNLRFQNRALILCMHK